MAAGLSAVRGQLPELVFEAHSTDCQTREALIALVKDGFAILKVGPGRTFVLREALFPGQRSRTLRQTMESLMLDAPANWDRYYHGPEAERALQRHFSYSDRIRYYWPQPAAEEAVAELFALLGEAELPETLIGQYLGGLYPDVRSGRLLQPARWRLTRCGGCRRWCPRRAKAPQMIRVKQEECACRPDRVNLSFHTGRTGNHASGDH